MVASDPTTKGTILRSLIKFVERDLSASQQAAARAALSPADRELIEQPAVLASQKVSEFTLNHLTAEAAKAKSEDLESFGRRAGRAELADAVGVYRFLTIVLTPTALLHKASSLWSTVHSHGRLIVENEAPGAATIRLVDFPSEPAHCARMAGWFEGAAEMTRVKPYEVVHDQCLVRGDGECRWQLSWRK
jgi:predicted hydrocarbon binding protein